MGVKTPSWREIMQSIRRLVSVGSRAPSTTPRLTDMRRLTASARVRARRLPDQDRFASGTRDVMGIQGCMRYRNAIADTHTRGRGPLDLADPGRRRDLYEIVLVEGTLDDIQRLVNGAALVELWDQMYLPPWVRAAWRSLIDSARTAA